MAAQLKVSFIFLSFRYPFLPCGPHRRAAFKATRAFYCTKQQLLFFLQQDGSCETQRTISRQETPAVFPLHPVCPVHFDAVAKQGNAFLPVVEGF